MREMLIRTLPVILCIATALPARAGWEYPGEYIGDGWYSDNGARFVVAVRGGASYGSGTIENRLGALSPLYVAVDDGGIDYCRDDTCANYLGYAELGNLPAAKDFSGFSFVAGASVGFTMPYRPQWRMELSWDHIGQTDYNAAPLFEGEAELIGSDIILLERVGAVNSSIVSDIVGVMAFYDFYEGLYKPVQTVVPYVGFGIGYAQSKTTLELIDAYGALTWDADMRNFGEFDGSVVQFPKTESEQGNFAAILAAGLSYGLTENMFLDFGGRLMYIPDVKWRLENADGTRHRDVFGAKNLFYGAITLGLRFEF